MPGPLPSLVHRRRGGAVAAVVVVAGMAAAMVWTVVDVRTRPGSDPLPDDAAAALVDAWHRSRTGTYHATGEFRRVAADDRSLAATIEIAQRPPDRLVLQFGEVTGHRGDRRVTCPPPVGGADRTCVRDQRVLPFADLVAAEVAEFQALFDGVDPLYTVRQRSISCWRITRTRFDPRSGFGLEADLCFDQATGAVRSIAVDHGDIDETTTYHEIDPVVDDADLDLPGPLDGVRIGS